MEVSFGGCSLAEVRDSDAVLLIDSVLVAGTRSLGYLGAEWRGDSDDVEVATSVVDRHLLALAEIVNVACQLVTHLLN